MNTPIIAVLCGGTSSEREVSLGSGKAVAQAMALGFPTVKMVLEGEVLPPELDPQRHVVCSTMHGTFGEDGGMQQLLETAGISYAGCDAKASDLCFDKWRTRQTVSAAGVRIAPGRLFRADAKPTAEELIREYGEQVVFKPNRQGSSVGLAVTTKRAEVVAALAGLTPGDWIVEKRILGRELTIGLLRGQSMGVVELVPQSGVFDYKSKYTKGLTEYYAPAALAEEIARQVRAAAETAFAAGGCRDYARIDFMLSEHGEIYLLEINTLPGMKETSLLPMSARCVGLDFSALCREMVGPAVERFHQTQSALR